MTKKNATKSAARALQDQQGGQYQRHLRTVGGGGGHASKSKSWTCDECKHPIASGDGYVLVMDAKSHGHPQRASSMEVELTEQAIEARRAKGEPTEPPFGCYSLGEMRIPKRQIDFAVCHQKCDAEPDTNAYWISVERAETLEEWCGWVQHMCEKKWMSKRDIREMLALWFENRGQDPHRLAG